MSIKESKEAVRRYYELFNRKEFDKCNQLIAPGFISHRTTGDVSEENMKNGGKILFTAFPDLRLFIEHIVAEGDMVSFREVATGTHTGDFMGIPPTGKPFKMINACTLRVNNGKWAEAWTNIDDLNMLQQIGVIQPLGQK
jgi:predicted ester cyclase